MRVFELIVAVITAILIFSTLVCGLWIRFAGDAVADRAESIKFHSGLAIVTAIFVIIMLITIFIGK